MHAAIMEKGQKRLQKPHPPFNIQLSGLLLVKANSTGPLAELIVLLWDPTDGLAYSLQFTECLRIDLPSLMTVSSTCTQ